MQFPAGTIYHFDSGAFTQGKRTTRYKNAPAGLFYPGDAGFPSKAGMNKQWKNFAPRAGVAWDPKGDGRMSIRASYGIFYDMIPAQYHLNTVAAPPWGVRITLVSPPGGFADPWRGYPGGNPFPVQFVENASFPTAGTFNTFNYDTHNAYAESWNVTVQRQVRTDWLLSASYLGNQFVHLFGAEEINPAVFIPGGPCTINGVTYNPCSMITNTNQRRRLFLENPKDGQSFGSVTRWDDGGTGNYKALLLSAQRRFSRGVIITGNYTWSHCISDAVNSLPGGGDGVHVISGNRRADRGNCNTSASDRRHVANIAAVAETPKFSGKWLGILANRWSISVILTLSSGAFLTATTGFDRALTGIGSQRPDQILDDIYGDKSFTKYLNPAAFAVPSLGRNGNLGVATILGPGLWN